MFAIEFSFGLALLENKILLENLLFDLLFSVNIIWLTYEGITWTIDEVSESLSAESLIGES